MRRMRAAAVVAAAVLAAGSAPPVLVPFILAPDESALTFVVSRPGEIIEGRAPQLSGEARIDPQRPHEGATVALQIGAAALETANGMRDRKMRRSHLETDSHPAIVFRSTLVELSGPGPLREGEPRKATVRGVLALHGVERTLQIPFVLRYDGGSILADGEASFRLSDHGIAIPRFLWMVLEDKVTVKFHCVLRRPA